MPTSIAILLFVPGLIVVVAATVKLVEFRRASRYLAATGKVVKSKPETRRRDGRDGQFVVENVPGVAYAFEVCGKKYRGERISVGEVAGNCTIETTLARYPVGKDVTVFYDPNDPSRSVLERDLPPGFWKGMFIAGVVFVGAPAFAAWNFSSLPAAIASYLPRPEQAGVVIAESVFALFFAGIGQAYLRQYLTERRYAAAIARVAKTRIIEFTTYSFQRYCTYYRADIEYEYRVGDRVYRGNNLRSWMTVSFRSRERAERLAKQYPEGSEITIHHDPAEPSRSVVDRVWWPAVVFWGLALACAAAAFASAR
jgi:Protein of unknown function (DUF3592)